MNTTELYEHQINALNVTKHRNRVAYYLDMGLGKTFVGAEKMHRLNEKVNLVVCQKSKIQDWIEHFTEYYYSDYLIFDLTNKNQYKYFFDDSIYSNKKSELKIIGVINYELAFRRLELKKLKDFTLMLDESSLIQNENAKRSKFILSLEAENVILLSGTPTGGKYEKLWSQMQLLGWNISKALFWKQYVKYHIDKKQGFPITIVDGYKNVDRLKEKMREYGCVFMKTEDVISLPHQIHQHIKVDATKEYRKFRKNSIVLLPEKELVGDTALTKMLYERQLCGQYNRDKLKAFRDLVESTNDRLIVFYNFTAELQTMIDTIRDLPLKVSVVNGEGTYLEYYEKYNDSITFIQYQAGAMGLNLQKANKIVYFTPPLSSELFEQSKKRIHRVGQERPCFYYYLTCRNSIEEKIYKRLEMRKDYTQKLFESED